MRRPKKPERYPISLKENRYRSTQKQSGKKIRGKQFCENAHRTMPGKMGRKLGACLVQVCTLKRRLRFSCEKKIKAQLRGGGKVVMEKKNTSYDGGKKKGIPAHCRGSSRKTTEKSKPNEKPSCLEKEFQLLEERE